MNDQLPPEERRAILLTFWLGICPIVFYAGFHAPEIAAWFWWWMRM